MNYLELCQRLHLELGIGQGGIGTKPDAVNGQSDKLLQIVTWINQAWTEIQLAQGKGAWRWMLDEATLETTAGTQAYNVASQRSIAVTSITRSGSTATVTFSVAHNLSTGDQLTIAGAVETAYNGTYPVTGVDATSVTYTVTGTPTTPATGTITATKVLPRFDEIWPFRARYSEPYILGHDVSLGVSNQQPIYYTPYTQFDGFYDRGDNLSQGRPIRFSVDNAGRLVLWPIPDAVYRLNIPYRKSVQELTTNADTPEMPEKFHMAIVYRAGMYYAGSTEANRVGPNFAGLYRTMYRKMCFEQLPDVIVGTR